MTSIKKILHIIIPCMFIIAVLILPYISFADTSTTVGNTTTVTKIENPLGADGPKTLPAFIEKLLAGAFQIAIPIIALAFIYCGFLYVKAMGKPEAISKAHDALLYTVIGAAVLMGSIALARLIVETLQKL